MSNATDPPGPGSTESDPASVAPVGFEPTGAERMPRWIWKAIAIFWLGYLVTLTIVSTADHLHSFLLLLLVSLFVALAVEPGVNKLVRRGWRRGRATGVLLLIVVTSVLVFATAIGTLIATQLADLARNSEQYVNDVVDFLNNNFGTNIDPTDVNESITDPEGPVQEFIKNQSGRAVRISATALGLIFNLFAVLLFAYYLVADGPRLRRAVCARLTPDRQRRVLSTWDLAITKTGGYLYSRALLAGLSALFHWMVFEAIGTPAPVALAVWVGIVSQFLPVIGTYVAGVLPVLLTVLESPVQALVVVGFIVVYQQIENYLFAPRITARTMEMHPAVAFGAALAGAAVIGPVGAVLALPAAAMAQAIGTEYGRRHEVIEDPLTDVGAAAGMQRRRPWVRHRTGTQQ
jgi:predicted PurR-regulated permease PerM